MLNRTATEALIAGARAQSDIAIAAVAAVRALDPTDPALPAANLTSRDARYGMHDLLDTLEDHVGFDLSQAVRNWHRSRVIHDRHLAFMVPTTGEVELVARQDAHILTVLDATYA